MKTKMTWTIMIVVLMGFIAASTAEAGFFGHQGKARHARPGFVGLRPFHQLNLSDTQRAQIKDIITKFRDARKDLQTDIQEQRMDLSYILQSESFNEESAREAFRKGSAAREDMFILRAKMMMEIKAVLTPEQLELLKEQKAKRMERLSRLLGKGVEKEVE